LVLLGDGDKAPTEDGKPIGDSPALACGQTEPLNAANLRRFRWTVCRSGVLSLLQMRGFLDDQGRQRQSFYPRPKGSVGDKEVRRE
jgi:hypothetical protein